MDNYKFRFKHSDLDIAKIQAEVEDNMATNEAVDKKAPKVTNVKASPPKNRDLVDGDTVLYDDGTNVWRYYKAGGRLFKQQLTEV